LAAIRGVILGFVLTVIGGILVSCAAQNVEADFVIGAWPGDGVEIIESLVESYPGKFSHPVRVEVIPEDIYHDQLWSYLLAKSSHWDLALAQSQWLPTWVDYQAVLPVDLKVDLAKEGASDFSLGGAVYGVSISEDYPVLWMRKDLFEKSFANTSPISWLKIMEAAQSVSEPPTRFGLALANDEVSAGETFLMVYSGFQVEEGDSAIAFKSEVVASAMDFLRMATQDGVLPAEPLGTDDIVQKLQNGEVAMGVLWISDSGRLLDCQASSYVCNGESSMLVGVRLPHPPSYESRKSTGLILPIGADDAEEAHEFIVWLDTPDGQSALRAAVAQTDSSKVKDLILPDPFLSPVGSEFRSVYSDRFVSSLNQIIYTAIQNNEEVDIILNDIDRVYREEENRDVFRP